MDFVEMIVDVKLRPHARILSRLIDSDFFCGKTTVSRDQASEGEDDPTRRSFGRLGKFKAKFDNLSFDMELDVIL